VQMHDRGLPLCRVQPDRSISLVCPHILSPTPHSAPPLNVQSRFPV
jgi:hypothetical protein